MKEKWLIYSTEHRAWWKPDWNGYTTKRKEAGLYSFEEACRVVENANIGLHDVPNESMIKANLADQYDDE